MDYGYNTSSVDMGNCQVCGNKLGSQFFTVGGIRMCGFCYSKNVVNEKCPHCGKPLKY